MIGVNSDLTYHPQHFLYFLPLAQRHGSLHDGVLRKDTLRYFLKIKDALCLL